MLVRGGPIGPRFDHYAYVYAVDAATKIPPAANITGMGHDHFVRLVDSRRDLGCFLR